jgi:hypothetical protein
VWSKRFGKFLLVLAYIRWCVEILLAAFIAPNPERAIERRQRGNSVGFAQRDPMVVEELLAKMKPAVLAENDPAITTVFPHTHPHALDLAKGIKGG